MTTAHGMTHEEVVRSTLAYPYACTRVHGTCQPGAPCDHCRILALGAEVERLRTVLVAFRDMPALSPWPPSQLLDRMRQEADIALRGAS